MRIEVFGPKNGLQNLLLKQNVCFRYEYSYSRIKNIKIYQKATENDQKFFSFFQNLVFLPELSGLLDFFEMSRFSIFLEFSWCPAFREVPVHPECHIRTNLSKKQNSPHIRLSSSTLVGPPCWEVRLFFLCCLLRTRGHPRNPGVHRNFQHPCYPGKTGHMRTSGVPRSPGKRWYSKGYMETPNVHVILGKQDIWKFRGDWGAPDLRKCNHI